MKDIAIVILFMFIITLFASGFYSWYYTKRMRHTQNQLQIIFPSALNFLLYLDEAIPLGAGILLTVFLLITYFFSR